MLPARSPMALLALTLLIAVPSGMQQVDATAATRSLRKHRGVLIEQSYTTVVDGHENTLKYQLYIPHSCDGASGKSGTPLCQQKPIIVFLHGRGESGGFDVTNAQSLPSLLLNNRTFTSSFDFIAVIPQCPSYCAEQNGWDALVLRSITALIQNYLVGDEIGGDRSRVYLAGQSMGGNGAWVYAAQQAQLFAAVVVVCGYASGRGPIAKRIVASQTAILVCHSADDSVIPVSASDDMVQALTEHGHPASLLKYVRYEHAPGPPIPEFASLIGHGSYELIFRDATLYSWLLQHRLGLTIAAQSPWHPLSYL